MKNSTLRFIRNDITNRLERRKFSYEPEGTIQIAKNSFTLAFMISGIVWMFVFGLLIYHSSRSFSNLTDLDKNCRKTTLSFVLLTAPYLWIIFLISFAMGYSFSLCILLIPVLPAYLVRLVTAARLCEPNDYPKKKYYISQFSALFISFAVPLLIYAVLERCFGLSYILILNGV